MRTSFGSGINRARGIRTGSVKIEELDTYVLIQSPNDSVSVKRFDTYVILGDVRDHVNIPELRTYVIVEP